MSVCVVHCLRNSLSIEVLSEESPSGVCLVDVCLNCNCPNLNK